MIKVYDTQRNGVRDTAVCLCDRHREARMVLGWTIENERPSFSPVPACDDCKAAQQPTVLDRVIAEGDASAVSDEPEPVRVLPGQRRLFE